MLTGFHSSKASFKKGGRKLLIILGLGKYHNRNYNGSFSFNLSNPTLDQLFNLENLKRMHGEMLSLGPLDLH